jgi:ATP-dependent DNA helicase RecG
LRLSEDSQSRSQSSGIKILHLLEKELLGKAELSGKLGQKEISGHLNKTIRMFLSDLLIEMTLPDKPNSRLQKYRLTEKGKEYLKSQEKQ